MNDDGTDAAVAAVEASPGAEELDLTIAPKGPAPTRKRVLKSKVEKAATIVRAPQPDLDVAPEGCRPARPVKEVATDDEIARAVGAWLAVPEGEREHATLADLARAEGFTSTRVHNALRQPKAFQMALTATAAAVMPRLPAVLATLADEAEEGNVRAADTLLRHCRELARMVDEQTGATPGRNLALHLEQTASVARELVSLADTLAGVRPVNGSIVPVDAEVLDSTKPTPTDRDVDAPVFPDAPVLDGGETEATVSPAHAPAGRGAPVPASSRGAPVAP